LKSGTEIIVACPGRLLDLAGDGHVRLQNIEVLVLDEADRMCDMGFLPDIRRILKLLPQKRQTLFFSATMPEDIRELSAQILDNPLTVQIGHIAPAKTVAHSLYPIPQKQKKHLLLAMLDQLAISRALVFTRTKRRARFLARDLEKQGFNATALQGNMSQNKRQRAIDGFRQGKFDILVATDIAARGIDVEEISHVINFDMPDTTDAYTHRIGRTGRATESGEAFTFVCRMMPVRCGKSNGCWGEKSPANGWMGLITEDFRRKRHCRMRRSSRTAVPAPITNPKAAKTTAAAANRKEKEPIL
jgi:ATP-dependent RNA helicase RhlE